MTQESSTMPHDMDQDLLERELLLLEREAELDATQKMLDQKEQELIVRESAFDRKDLDLEWEQLEDEITKFNQTELGMRVIALEEEEKKLKMKKQELQNWNARIQACRDNHNRSSHFGPCGHCQD